MILSLQKNYKDYTESLYIPNTSFPQLLTSYVSMPHVSQLMNQLWHTIINWSPYFTQISLVSA